MSDNFENDDKKIKLIIDDSVVEKYSQYYFKNHPRAKKKPIERPTIPSLNTWIILPRIQMNALKQKHKDFIVWFINDIGFKEKQLNNFKVKYTIYMPTKRRSDPDNFTPKFWNDGFVESGFFIDDDGKHLKELTLITDYDKERPRTEIEITVLD